MSFWESRKVENTRKPHECEYCGVKIKIGDSCYNEKGTCEGSFNNYYLCNRCHEITPITKNEYNDYLGGFMEDVVYEGYIKCPECECNSYSKVEMPDDMLSCRCTCKECGEVWIEDLSAESIRILLDDDLYWEEMK